MYRLHNFSMHQTMFLVCFSIYVHLGNRHRIGDFYVKPHTLRDTCIPGLKT